MKNLQITISTAIFAAFGAAIVIAAPVGAVTVYTAALNSMNEVPIAVSPGSGNGTLTLANDQNSFTVFLNYSNLSSNAVAAHVHCCALPGSNAPVAVGFTVPGGLSGTVTGVFDLTQSATYTSSFLTASGGTAAGARTRFLTGLAAGQAYYNVHSQSLPTGEIRGQLLLQAAAVPEPASWALMITGFALVGGTMRRRATMLV